MEPFTIKPNHIVIKCCGVLCPLMLVHLASKFKIFCGKAECLTEKGIRAVKYFIGISPERCGTVPSPLPFAGDNVYFSFTASFCNVLLPNNSLRLSLLLSPIWSVGVCYGYLLFFVANGQFYRLMMLI